MAVKLLILFIALPILELWLLIKIGGAIGVLPTIALVVLTALVGSQLVRRQGLAALERVRASQARGEAPALPLLEGAALLLAGFMLLTPGFVSDIFGFLLLVPGLRERIARRLLARVVIVQPGAGTATNERYAGHGEARRDQPSVLEGDYRRGGDDTAPGDGSGPRDRDD